MIDDDMFIYNREPIRVSYTTNKKRSINEIISDIRVLTKEELNELLKELLAQGIV